jgi:hypothetical protein
VSQYAVFTSSTINGSYTFNHAEQPMGYMSRDCNVFKDDDGKAYFVTSSNNNYDLELFQMTSDYLNIASHVSTIYNGDHREAPVIFKRSGVYYLLTSAATGWDSNQGQYSTATSLSGSWTARTNFGSSNTYDTQPATFIQVTGSQTTTFIYCGDRWQDPDLPSSKYIWMPITFSGTSMSLPNATTWTINLSTGVVSGGGGGGTLANGTYKIINRNSGKALDVSKQATTNSTLVGQYSYWGGSGQKWTVTQLGNGQYSIIGMGSGKALDVFNRSTADSAPIDIYTYSGDNCQKWIITATTGGYYEVIGVGSGKALEVFNQSTADNAPVDQYTYFGGNSQQWAFQAP